MAADASPESIPNIAPSPRTSRTAEIGTLLIVVISAAVFLALAVATVVLLSLSA